MHQLSGPIGDYVLRSKRTGSGVLLQSPSHIHYSLFFSEASSSFSELP